MIGAFLFSPLLLALTCPESGLKLTEADLNDNYCDCPISGFDEPSKEEGSQFVDTSACPNGKFFCANKDFHGKEIASYMVHDGVCDCCDGSDEPEGKCPDICAAERKAFELEEQRRKAKITAGIQKQAEMKRTAEQKLADLTTRKLNLEQRVAELNVKVELEKTEKLESVSEDPEIAKLKERIRELEEQLLQSSPSVKSMEKESWWDKVIKNPIISTITETVTRTIFSQPTNSAYKSSEAQRELNEARRELNEIEEALQRDYGTDNLRMAWLNQCFQLEQDK